MVIVALKENKLMSHTNNLAIDNQNFLKEHDKSYWLNSIPNYSELSPEEKDRAKKALIYGRANVLTQVFGVDSDSDTDGSNTNCGNGSEKEHG